MITLTYGSIVRGMGERGEEGEGEEEEEEEEEEGCRNRGTSGERGRLTIMLRLESLAA